MLVFWELGKEGLKRDHESPYFQYFKINQYFLYIENIFILFSIHILSYILGFLNNCHLIVFSNRLLFPLFEAHLRANNANILLRLSKSVIINNKRIFFFMTT